MNTTENIIFDALRKIIQGQDPFTGNPLEDTSFLKNEKIVDNFKRAINIQIKLEGIANQTIPARGGERWTKSEENAVIKHFMKGDSIIKMAKKLQRTTTAVGSRIIRSGALDDCVIDKSINKRPDDRYRTGLQWNEKEVEILNDLRSLGIPLTIISLCLLRDDVEVKKMNPEIIG